MKIYHYDKFTNLFTYECDADIDPIETLKAGRPVYYTPANATIVKPPVTQGFEKAIYNNGWEITYDYRGEYAVNSDMEVIQIQEIGALPEGYIHITEEEASRINENPIYYIIQDGQLVPNPDYQIIKGEQNRKYLYEQVYLIKAAAAYGGITINNEIVFETNQVSITNISATLELMTESTNWKFYTISGIPVSYIITKKQLQKIGQFAQKFINDCFSLEAVANNTILYATTEQLNDNQWINDFIAEYNLNMNAINRNMEVNLS